MNRANSNTNPRSGKNAFPPPLNVNKRSPPPTTSKANAEEKPAQDNNNAKSNPEVKGKDKMDENYEDAPAISPASTLKPTAKASSQYANNFSKADARFSTAAQSSYGAFDPLDYAASEAPPLPTEESEEASEELRQRRREEKQRREEEWEEEQAQRKRERERLAQERRQREIQEEEEKRRREWAEEEERRKRREEEEDFDEEVPRRQSPPRQEQYQRRPSGTDRRNSYARHSFHRNNDSRDYRRYNSNSNSNSNSNNNSGNEEENARGDPRRERININMNDAWQSWTNMGGRDDRGGFGIGGTPGFGLFGGQRAGFGPVGNLPINMPLNSMPGLGGFRMFGL